MTRSRSGPSGKATVEAGLRNRTASAHSLTIRSFSRRRPISSSMAFRSEREAQRIFLRLASAQGQLPAGLVGPAQVGEEMAQVAWESHLFRPQRAGLFQEQDGFVHSPELREGQPLVADREPRVETLGLGPLEPDGSLAPLFPEGVQRAHRIRADGRTFVPRAGRRIRVAGLGRLGRRRLQAPIGLDDGPELIDGPGRVARPCPLQGPRGGTIIDLMMGSGVQESEQSEDHAEDDQHDRPDRRWIGAWHLAGLFATEGITEHGRDRDREDPGP